MWCSDYYLDRDTEEISTECCREHCPYPLGKGEWVAETLEDAKQMALNYADAVS